MILHYELFAANEYLLRDASCTSKKQTLYNYEKHLFDIRVWPLEQFRTNTSIKVILDRLKTFTYSPAPGACLSFCKRDYASLAEKARVRVKDYFDGLCLDCLDKSQPKTGDLDEDYYRHGLLKESEWPRGCRFHHKQPTWYYSFLGREQDRVSFRRRLQQGIHGRFDEESD